MAETRIRVRANKTTGELEIEGPTSDVAEWWERLWPEVSQLDSITPSERQLGSASRGGSIAERVPEVFGEFYTAFRSDVTDVDRVLIAAAFLQERDQDRIFTTKSANQALLDQNVKVTNPSENVRRLIQTKRAFVVSDGKYRVSAGGFEHLKTLKIMPK